MSNEELLEQISNGDEAALTKLYLMNTGLVKDRAWFIARTHSTNASFPTLSSSESVSFA